MGEFKGFPPGRDAQTPLPEDFFREILPAIEQIEELKVLLFIFWRFNRMEGNLAYFWHQDFLADEVLKRIFGGRAEAAAEMLERGIQAGVTRGTLLKAEVRLEGGLESIILLNTARGQAAVQAIKDGTWQPTPGEQLPGPQTERPSIFLRYEENIGPLTPMIAETLKEAEADYPADWIEEAMKIAVENNVRRWRYIDAILRSWQEEGKDERQTRGDIEEDRHRYVRGKFSKFIEH
jgi:DnaD/phage-associated family protein